jgi:hypothetical protein
MPDVEQDFGLPPPRIAAVKLNDPVLERAARSTRAATAPRRTSRSAAERCDTSYGRRVEKTLGVRTFDLERAGCSGLVGDFDQKNPPALFVELAGGRTWRDPNAHFGVDGHTQQAEWIQDPPGISAPAAASSRLAVAAAIVCRWASVQRGAEERECFLDAFHLRDERLQFDPGDESRLRCAGSTTPRSSNATIANTRR